MWKWRERQADAFDLKATVRAYEAVRGSISVEKFTEFARASVASFSSWPTADQLADVEPTMPLCSREEPSFLPGFTLVHPPSLPKKDFTLRLPNDRSHDLFQTQKGRTLVGVNNNVDKATVRDPTKDLEIVFPDEPLFNDSKPAVQWFTLPKRSATSTLGPNNVLFVGKSNPAIDTAVPLEFGGEDSATARPGLLFVQNYAPEDVATRPTSTVASTVDAKAEETIKNLKRFYFSDQAEESPHFNGSHYNAPWHDEAVLEDDSVLVLAFQNETVTANKIQALLGKHDCKFSVAVSIPGKSSSVFGSQYELRGRAGVFRKRQKDISRADV